MLPGLLRKVKRLDRTSTSSPQTAGEMVSGLSGGMQKIVNPYSSYSYENGLFDKLGDFLGFRTNQDKFREEMMLKANEFNAQLQSVQAQNEYNSPEAQASRSRAAGINPQLAGVENIGSASPGAVDSSGLAAALDPSANGSAAAALGSAAFSAFQGCVGVMSALESLKGMRIQNDLNEFSFIERIYGAGRKYAKDSYTPDGRHFENPESYSEYLDLYGLRNMRGSKQRFRAFERGYADMMVGALGSTELTGVREGAALSKLKEKSIERSGIESDSYIEDFSRFAGEYLKKLQYETSRLEYLKARAASTSFQNEISYNQAAAELGLPAAEAEAGVAEAGLSKAVAAIQSRVARESGDIVKKAFDKSPILGFLTQLFVGDVTKPFDAAASSLSGAASKVVTGKMLKK